MSLDIDLTNKDGEIVIEMNWLRNPFGLRNWIKDNTGVDVWNVVNNHSYDDSPNVDRLLFGETVTEAWEKVEDLAIGYFRLSSQFYTPNLSCELHLPAKDDYWVGMEHYNVIRDSLGCRPGECLQHYKDWTKKLHRFGELLQDESLTYCCSN